MSFFQSVKMFLNTHLVIVVCVCNRYNESRLHFFLFYYLLRTLANILGLERIGRSVSNDGMKNTKDLYKSY